MIKLLLVIAIAVFYTAMQYPGSEVAQLPQHAVAAAEVAEKITAGDEAIRRAFESKAGGLQVTAKGTVDRLLPDDDKGGRHQRFILRLPIGLTVMIAHNIDLAPRIQDLKAGDTVEFNGVYEWNSKGGVVHWTHHDPRGQHEAGWLRHQGATYQ